VSGGEALRDCSRRARSESQARSHSSARCAAGAGDRRARNRGALKARGHGGKIPIGDSGSGRRGFRAVRDVLVKFAARLDDELRCRRWS